MKYNAFISYSGVDVEIVENLRDHINRYGVTAWVYSLDRTLAVDAWEEIQARIEESDLVIFVVSDNTPNAEGQQKELKLALEKVEPLAGTEKILPIVITGKNFSALPDELRYKNGLYFDAYKVKSVAWKIATRAFPSLLKAETENPWKFPIPGEWLEVSNLDEMIEQHFDIGDKLYFRALGPMGLLECYAPRIKGLFWIAQENVKASSDVETDKELESHVPMIFRVSGMIKLLQLGWKVWHANDNQNNG
ncbi:conserved hypothetical protein [delta proteobacterium NaphS2]|nr:conserved hypothetical protein [delta proteobacterium NaphS2]